MKSFKKSLSIIIGIVMILALTACGGGSGSGDSEGTGQFVVATSPDFAPMEFVDTSKEGDEQYVGFDITLAQAIADELGLELVIKPMSFDAVQAAVQTGSVDAGISGFSWTEERAENYYLTRWYKASDNEEEQIIITTKDKEGTLTKAEDFAGLKVGAQGASLQKMFVEQQLPDAECVVMENLNDLVTSLMTGKIDALAVAFGNGEAFISNNPDKLGETGFAFEVDELYKNNVIMLNKNNAELGEKINAILDEQEKAGVWPKWYEEAKAAASGSTVDESGFDAEGNKLDAEGNPVQD